MLVTSWKEPLYPKFSYEKQDYSKPSQTPYRQHEIHVDEFGFEADGYCGPLYAAIRHFVDGEVVHERRFPKWKDAMRHIKARAA